MSPNNERNLQGMPLVMIDSYQQQQQAYNEETAANYDKKSDSTDTESSDESRSLGHVDNYEYVNMTVCLSKRVLLAILAAILVLHCFGSIYSKHRIERSNIGGGRMYNNRNVVTIEHAKEELIAVDKNNDDIKLYVRSWGNRETGTPVLFVHGGPGNAVADYNNGNAVFFDANDYFVVQVDQRGTGKSVPSVRDDTNNYKYYENDASEGSIGISIDIIADDYETVRKHFNIDQWLVFGGSFGSTIAINYAERHPKHCLSLILRGIYLDTIPEVYAVYSRSSFEDKQKQLVHFDIMYNYAASQTSAVIDFDNAHQLMQAYHDMIIEGDEQAIWHWFVFENNLMETDPNNILDPYNIEPSLLPQARSVAYFETTLWLHGSFDAPATDLTSSDKIEKLSDIPLWICQGLYDHVCPPKYAHDFVDILDEYDISYQAMFVRSGHEATDPVMQVCLKEALREYKVSKSSDKNHGPIIDPVSTTLAP